MTLTLDRTKAPKAYDLKTMLLLHAETVMLRNGLKVFCINGAIEEVIKLELVFKTGTRAESKKLVASACNYLLNAGSTKMSSSEIMENLDFYGSFYQHDNQLDRATISIYTLKKYFKESLQIFAEIILDPVFPEEELAIYKENAKQRFLINSTKNDYRARQEFHRALFGNHPYGKLVEAQDYDALTREDLIEHYKQHYKLNDATLIMAGNFGDEEIKLLETAFQSYQYEENQKIEFISPNEHKPIKIFNERPDALQSAIRIGKQIMHKSHPDYIEFSILTTVLGGYFGSRLMSNIREDKGYTYGIGAGVYPLLDSAFFYIATEVGTEVTNAALEEIYKEMERLHTELIPEEELNLVKNYLKGAFIGSIENIFSHSDKFKSVYLYNLNYDYYDRYFKLVDGVSSERLAQLAKEYLIQNSLTEVVIGKK